MVARSAVLLLMTAGAAADIDVKVSVDWDAEIIRTRTAVRGMPLQHLRRYTSVIRSCVTLKPPIAMNVGHCGGRCDAIPYELLSTAHSFLEH